MFKYLALFFVGLFLVGVAVFLSAHRIAAWLPFAVEKQFVQPWEGMADRWLGERLADDPVIESFLAELAAELAIAMELPEDIELSVHYLDSADANAFATLGGHIFILRGLLEKVPDENSLAMVLAHEISHIKHRDPLASLGRGFVLQMIISYFTGGSSQGESLSSMGGNLGMLRYSRQQEERADLDAMAALHRHYGHVGGYDSFFREIIRSEGDTTEVPDWLQTHPDLEKRIEAMQREITRTGWNEDGPRRPLRLLDTAAAESGQTGLIGRP